MCVHVSVEPRMVISVCRGLGSGSCLFMCVCICARVS